MSGIKKTIIVGLIIAGCLGLDQVTKSVAKANLMYEPSIHLMKDMIRLQYTENTGAFLGFGSSINSTARFWIFTVIVGILLSGMFGYLCSRLVRETPEIIGWSLIVGGGFSNLIDRIFNKGAVVDFLNLGIGKLRTGIFNLADFEIMVGLFIILIYTVFYKEEETDQGKLEE